MLIFLVVVCFYWVFLSKNINKTQSLIIIQPKSTFENLIDTLSSHNVLKSEKSFKIAARLLKYEKIRVGKYNISDCSTNLEIVRLLRRGQHYPIKFTFNNIRTKRQFIDKVGENFFFNNSDLENLLNDDEFLSKYNQNTNTAVTLFIPNTYEIYYDITAEDFVDFMYKQYVKFWNKERKKLAEEIGLSETEISTLASIVEEENSRPVEKSIIAGLYINRLRKNMLLQSDPTIKFAIGDFSRQRILNEDLKIDSPYNTYLYCGLPPGPIRIPEASTMDSVLHYTHHNYLYMCAKEDFSGYHNFTESATVHIYNAAKYRAALNKKRIFK